MEFTGNRLLISGDLGHRKSKNHCCSILRAIAALPAWQMQQRLSAIGSL